ncbi:hypothetical protein C8F04DRAFT_1253819 [Mycena alexandri]|uniref:Uncharacterized protein n=1 Tax=Mycena alexandri TaxID=1745969 RepID=A0AAD6T7B4_9AGAR|nr:hypothetical protein C8F04DRAFT_1253819 [Mycena alexandri]
MTRQKKPGLSGSHKVSYGRPGVTNPTKSIPLNQTGEQLKKARERRQERVAALSFTQREALLGHGEQDIEMPDAPDYFPADWQDVDSDDEATFQALPPGEEGYLHSHAGKEASFHAILDKCQPGRGDPRRRALRVQNTINAWKEHLPRLVNAYLLLRKDGPANSDNVVGAWEIEVIGLDEYGPHSFMHTGDAKRTNETLLRHGYIGASPEKVSLAFPVRLFEIYRQIHRVCPRYTLGSLSTTLSNLHDVPRRAPLAEQLSTAYDAYLEIIRDADARVHAAMGRDAAWYIHNVCAPCMYKTVNELPLKFSWLGCMDGNNSLKLVDATFLAGNTRQDNRASTSFRWLTPAQVDLFKDEVADSQKRARSKKKVSTPAQPAQPASPSPLTSTLPLFPDRAATSTADTATAVSAGTSLPSPPPADVNGHDPGATGAANDDDGDVAWLNINELSGAESEELAKCVNVCVERWKAAGPEARKKMFAFFAVAGIFLTVCRHGHVVVMCDMIRSGELMKYPLAMVQWLLDHYGAAIGLGYDIMCAFFKTLMRSSLGAKVTAMQMRGVVPAFHGHAHNRACQIGWHPLYVEGVGLEDFEECERTFARSNNLAAATRLSTVFHRQQQIDEHFHFHDLDKHAASGNFIYQNYRQSLDKIVANGAQLSVLEASLGTTGADYEAYHATEVKYFQDLRKEPEEVQQTINYIAILQKHADAVAASNQAKKDFERLDHHILVTGYTKPQIAQVRTRYRTTYTRYVAVEEELCRFEDEHAIPIRWTPDSEEFKAGLGVATERKYRSALTEVERLVVLRLLELTKLGMSGLAYNLREKISKALKTRSEAIRRALLVYNEAAAALTPSRQRLTFAEVLQTTSIAEFDILRDTRQDIRQQPWTQPARREAMVLYFGIKRAKEEIRRLNVEITRLLTFLVDEHVDYYRAIATNLITNPPLAAELQRRWRRASRISAAICKRIKQTSNLVGFSGTIFPGQREDRDPNLGDGVPPPYWLAQQLGVTTMAVYYEEVPDGEAGSERHLQAEDDSEPVIRVLDVEEDNIAELMDHLSTFDDL